MPNIPPLATQVIKHRYFAAAILFLIYCLAIYTLPQTILNAVNAGLAGYFVGTKIKTLSELYETYANKL